MNREGKKCVLYPRVSTEMQVDGYSLEGQKNSLKRFADREEMEIVGIYEDAGKSGKSIEGRPAFKKMLSDIKNGLEIDYILVYKLSRFGRNAADILNSLEFVQSYGINLICIEEGIDSSQTSGKLLISVLSAVAEIERENIIEQTMNGRREKARQGGWNGGFAPYGYYLKDNQLLIEETEAEAIRIIFDKFANSDVGLGGVAKYLNLQGIKKIPRQNGTLETWSSHFIRLILDNPVYCGKIAYGRRTREKVKGTKKKVKWSSTKKSVATVNKKGVVTAKKKGTAYIKAKVGKKTYKCKVTVKSKKAPAKPAPTTPSAPVNPPAEPTATPTTAPAKTPVLSATSLSMRKGEYYQLNVQDPKHLPVWTSSNKNIAEVDSQGKVHAINVGTTEIKVDAGIVLTLSLIHI